MTQQQTIPAFQCGGVLCDERRLGELADGAVLVSINCSDIQRVALKHGVQAPHPLIQSAFGLVLTLVGLVPVVHFVAWMMVGGTFHALEACLAVFALIGPWLIFTAFRRGYYLQVDGPEGRKRLDFARSVRPEDVDQFITLVERAHPLKVVREHQVGGEK